MQLVYHCPTCQTLQISQLGQEQTVLVCPTCSWQRQLTSEFIEDDKPKRCLACGTEDLWRQKDFPQGLGLVFVVTAAIVSTYFWANVEPLWAIGVLMLMGALDLAVFWLMPDVLVCYRCKARHRRSQIDDEHPRFNLELAERYRQEAIRLAEAERQQAANKV